MSGDSNKKLVQQPGKYKDYDLSHGRRYPTAHQRYVNVSLHEIIYGLIPRRPVCANARDIPPISVEFPIAKTQDLSESVQERLEKSEETSKPAE